MPKGRFHTWVFRYTPAIMLAEPFECFLIAYGFVIGLIIASNVFLGEAQSPQLYAVLPKVLLLLWALTFAVGSVFIAKGLVDASKASAVSTEVRKSELAGLYIVGSALLLYLVAVPLRLPHDSLYHWSTLISSSIVLLGWLTAIGIRITLITSSVFLLAVSRLTRVRLLKEEFRKEASNGK